MKYTYFTEFEETNVGLDLYCNCLYRSCYLYVNTNYTKYSQGEVVDKGLEISIRFHTNTLYKHEQLNETVLFRKKGTTVFKRMDDHKEYSYYESLADNYCPFCKEYLVENIEELEGVLRFGGSRGVINLLNKRGEEIESLYKHIILDSKYSNDFVYWCWCAKCMDTKCKYSNILEFISERVPSRHEYQFLTKTRLFKFYHPVGSGLEIKFKEDKWDVFFTFDCTKFWQGFRFEIFDHGESSPLILKTIAERCRKLLTFKKIPEEIDITYLKN